MSSRNRRIPSSQEKLLRRIQEKSPEERKRLLGKHVKFSRKLKSHTKDRRPTLRQEKLLRIQETKSRVRNTQEKVLRGIQERNSERIPRDQSGGLSRANPMRVLREFIPPKKGKGKKRKSNLPKKLLLIKNKEKGFHEKWTQNRDKLNIPHPFRACLFGPPNSGKTNVVKNLLLRQKPEFQRMVVIHTNPYNVEYDDVECEMMGKIPGPEFFRFEKNPKTLVVLDDISFKHIKGDEKKYLNRLYGNWSTHNNISVVLCSQDVFQVPPIIRRCSNFFVLWKFTENRAISNVAGKVGMDCDKLKQLYKTFVKKSYDSIWIDKTKNTPYPLRFNGFDLIV